MEYSFHSGEQTIQTHANSVRAGTEGTNQEHQELTFITSLLQTSYWAKFFIWITLVQKSPWQAETLRILMLNVSRNQELSLSIGITLLHF